MGAGSVLHLIRALGALEGDRKPRLWLVTRGAQPVSHAKPGLAQAPLWGMGRSLALEYAGCWGGLIASEA